MSIITDKETGKKSFDLRTHIMDPKTGAITKVQPYRLHVSRDNGEFYERDGTMYTRGGEVISGKAKAGSAKIEAPAAPAENRGHRQ